MDEVSYSMAGSASLNGHINSGSGWSGRFQENGMFKQEGSACQAVRG